MILTLLIVLLLFAAVGGFLGYPHAGYAGWSPLGVILFIIVVLWLTGHL